MNKGILVAVVLALSLVAPALAVTVSYETSSVSRLVGPSPEAIMDQLDTTELNLNHASYYPYQTFSESLTQPLRDNGGTWRTTLALFGNADKIDLSWSNYDAIDTNAFIRNELLAVEDAGRIDGSRVTSTNGMPANLASQWNDAFSKNNPVFLLGSDYAGVAIPKGTGTASSGNLIGDLARYSHIVAPTWIHSRRLEQAFLCNLGNGRTLGDSFRTARNTYYDDTDISEDVIPSLALASYQFYGNPVTTTTTPQYDGAALKEACKRLLGDKEHMSFASQDFTTQATNTIIDSPSLPFTVQSDGTFDAIVMDGSRQHEAPGELMLPVVVKHYDLPKDAVVTGFNSNFANAERKTLNIPMVGNDLMVRGCYANSSPASITYTITSDDAMQQVNVFIYPVAVVDCAAGDFDIYKSASYTLTYDAPSPVSLIVVHPDTVLPGANIPIDITPAYAREPSATGSITIFADGTPVYDYELTRLVQTLNTRLTAPSSERITSYDVQYVDNGTVLYEKTFNIETKLLATALEIPEEGGTSKNIVLNVFNYGASDVPITVENALVLNGNKLTGETKSFTAKPGANEFTYAHQGLDRSVQQYGVRFDVAYGNEHRVLSGTLVTNNPPLQKPLEPVRLRAGDTLTLSLPQTDVDGDTITCQVPAPIDAGMRWKTTDADIGNHTFTLRASDGLVSQDLPLDVEVVANRVPELAGMDDIAVDAGDPVFVELYAYDDYDENLAFAIDDARFTQTVSGSFEWRTSAADAGTHVFTYRVTDGIAGAMRQFRVNVTVPCTPSWSCGPWGACAGGQQSRACTDANACGVSDGKPAERQSCVAPSCSSNAQCGTDGYENAAGCADNKVVRQYATYTCSNPGAANAQCVKTIRTDILQTCTASQTCANAQCVGNAVCSFNAQCGTDGYEGVPLCSGNNVTQQYRTYTCNNPGTSHSSCSSNAESRTKQTCAAGQTCSGGACVATACSSNAQCGTDQWVPNTNRCDGNQIVGTWRSFTCNNPGAANANCSSTDITKTFQACAAGQSCDAAQCKVSACTTNAQCGTDGYENAAGCADNKVVRQYAIYTCNTPGAANAQCVKTTRTDILQTCTASQTCANAQCVNKVVCSSNAQCGTDGFVGSPTCAGGNVVQAYKTYVCINPGTAKSMCLSNNNNQRTLSVCSASQACEVGQCRDVACRQNSDCGTSGLQGARQCSNNNVVDRYRTFECLLPGTGRSSCAYADAPRTVEYCLGKTLCSDNRCVSYVCGSDGDCGCEVKNEPYCSVSRDEVMREVRVPRCNNPGTLASQCLADTSIIQIATCGLDSVCEGSACRTDRCTPAKFCLDTLTLKSVNRNCKETVKVIKNPAKQRCENGKIITVKKPVGRSRDWDDDLVYDE